MRAYMYCTSLDCLPTYYIGLCAYVLYMLIWLQSCGNMNLVRIEKCVCMQLLLLFLIADALFSMCIRTTEVLCWYDDIHRGTSALNL